MAEGALIDRLRARFPAGDLEYLRTLATTLLAVLVLPLALLHFVLHPLEVADHAIGSRVP